MKTKDLDKSEYGAFYAGYIRVLGEVELIVEMKARQKAFNDIFDALSPDDLGYRYAPGKWSIAELLLHIIDSERVFQYRALRIGRGDKTDLPGFDQDLFVTASGAASRTLVSLREEYNAVRLSSISLFQSFSESSLLNMGSADSQGVSVRALGFMICGHQKHHEEVLKSRYLQK